MKVKFSVSCMAIYQSQLDIPEENAKDKESVLAYIQDNLSDCNVENLEFLGDLAPEEAVTLEDIQDYIPPKATKKKERGEYE